MTCSLCLCLQLRERDRKGQLLWYTVCTINLVKSALSIQCIPSSVWKHGANSRFKRQKCSVLLRLKIPIHAVQLPFDHIENRLRRAAVAWKIAPSTSHGPWTALINSRLVRATHCTSTEYLWEIWLCIWSTKSLWEAVWFANKYFITPTHAFHPTLGHRDVKLLNSVGGIRAKNIGSGWTRQPSGAFSYYFSMCPALETTQRESSH